MKKKIVALTIDITTAERFQKLLGRGNVSADIEEYMERRLAAVTDTISYIDAEILDKDIQKKKEQIDELVTELKPLEEKREEILTTIEEKERDELLARKEQEENTKKCVLCKGYLDDTKKYTTKKGEICRSCYNGLDAQSLSELF